MDVSVEVNRLVFDYDQIVIIGPVFPHEVVGFSGGNKYLFPGVSGPEVLNFFHWLGAVVTNPEPITFDRNTNQVIWRPGDITTGTGISKPPREVAFQIVFTPSLSQVKSTAALMQNINFSATDVFTNKVFNTTKDEIITTLSTDPKVKFGDEVVVP
jgi:nickel-dependent lactate racemase